MIAETKKLANKWLLIGFLVWFVGNVLSGQDGAIATLGSLVVLGGIGTFIHGCMLYSQAKGYNKWIGLLGLLNIVGMLILVLLPDKLKIKSV